MERRIDAMRATGRITLGGSHEIALTEGDFILRPLTMLPFHPNALTITARNGSDAELHRETYFSVGGGFVVTEAESRETASRQVDRHPSSFGSAKQLLELCHEKDCKISDLMLELESATREASEVRARLLHIRD